MVNTTAGDLDDQDEDNDGLSGNKQKKFTFLPAFGAYSALLVGRNGHALICSRYNPHYLL